eukprot:scaffold41954_cov30-Prasinocladus_malaysianus.AAC.1
MHVRHKTASMPLEATREETANGKDPITPINGRCRCRSLMTLAEVEAQAERKGAGSLARQGLGHSIRFLVGASY